MDMDIPTENNEPPILNVQPTKRRKKSVVWDYFTIETVGADCTRAYCKQCRKSFAYISGSKLAGTSHLKRHIVLGICPVSRSNQGKNQSSPYGLGLKPNGAASGTDLRRKRYRSAPVFPVISFNQDLCNRELAKMIILHEYPLNIVEHQGFTNFVQTLQPKFNIASVDSIQMACVSVHLSEKERLLNLISGISSRVSLSLDLWTTDETRGYVFLTGQFVDVDWKLQRRILNVVMVPFPDSEVALNHAVTCCLNDWGLESKLFTLTLDESFANVTVRENLRRQLSNRNPLVLNGQLLIGSCYARVLTSLALDALGSMKETIKKVRDSVKYVKTSEFVEEKFVKLKQQLQVPSMKSLTIDNQTKWNTTYHMLVAALELKEVFSCLDTSDPNYIVTPSMDEWKQLETLCTYLKLLFEAANALIATPNPPANLFFHEVWKIQLELIHGSMSKNPIVSTLIKPLKEKFDQYWSKSNMVLAIAAVMDPRFKMKLVDFSFSRIYGTDAENWIKIVEEGVHELFLDYVVQSLPPPTFVEEGNEFFVKTELDDGEILLSTGDGISEFEVYISEITGNQQMKSELDQYLEEPLLPRVQEFDVLGWWKLNSSKYPTLSKMASDVLSIPVSTVAPDSVFDTVSKKMDGYRASLRPATLEALICVKDWIRYGSSVQLRSSEISAGIVKMEKF